MPTKIRATAITRRDRSEKALFVKDLANGPVRIRFGNRYSSQLRPKTVLNVGAKVGEGMHWETTVVKNVRTCHSTLSEKEKTMSKTSKILQLLNYRLRITIQDGRVFVGNMLAFDKHMNLVLSECDEYRRIKPKGSAAGGAKSAVEREEKRSLGLVILRGETIVSMSIEAPPPPSDEARAKAGAPMGGSGGPGVARPAGRGLPLAPNAGVPAGLSGPVRGVGGPAAAAMMPQMGAPVAYGRPPVPPPGMFPPQMPPFPGAGRGFPPGGVPPGGPGAPPMPFPPMPGGRGMPPMPPGFRPPVGMPALPPGMPPPRPGMPFPPPPGFRPPQ